MVVFPAADINRDAPAYQVIDPLNQSAFFNADSGMNVAPKMIGAWHAALTFAEPHPAGIGISSPEAFGREAWGMDTDAATAADLVFRQGGHDVRASVNFSGRRHMPGSEAGTVMVFFHDLQSRGHGPGQSSSEIIGTSRFLSLH